MHRARSRLTRSARTQLVALVNGSIVGHVYQMADGRLAFQYEPSWRTSVHSYPLSHSMPLSVAEHGDRAIRAYLWGLLPDNPAVLEWWGRRFSVSPNNVIGLLANVGEDCAGAVQLVVPERVEHLLGEGTRSERDGSVLWLSDEQVRDRLRSLRLNPAAGRVASDTGQFSLAGAQPKTALYQSPSGRWGVPAGRMPTNRILKPPSPVLSDLACNEHFCLLLARQLGFSAAVSRVQHFGDETAIVLERYDREQTGDRLVRIHQEDMCQALAVPPTRKYEDDGGPGIPEIVGLLQHASTDSTEDARRFIDAIIFNWLIAATDAHAKNFSIFHAAGSQLRLTPLYDVITVLPYPDLYTPQSKLAMSIGGERRIATIDGTHWTKLSRTVGMNTAELLDRITWMSQEIDSAVEALNDDSYSDRHMQAVIRQLGNQVRQHTRECMRRM